MNVNRRAVIVSVLGATLAAGSAVRADDSVKSASTFAGIRESLSSVLEAVADGDLGKAAGGLFTLWGDGGAKSRIQKVSVDDTTWGGATGNPPPLPPRESPPPRQGPPRQEPPRQDPPRQEPPRQAPPPSEIPRLPPSVIPGTTRPTN